MLPEPMHLVQYVTNLSLLQNGERAFPVIAVWQPKVLRQCCPSLCFYGQAMAMPPHKKDYGTTTVYHLLHGFVGISLLALQVYSLYHFSLCSQGPGDFTCVESCMYNSHCYILIRFHGKELLSVHSVVNAAYCTKIITTPQA